MIGFAALSDPEQEEALARITDLRLRSRAGEENETGQMLRSLLAVRDRLGHTPTPDDYRQAHAELLDQGVEIEPLSRVIKHFGSWRVAKEALQLSGVTTPRKIDARFRSRRLGKVWRYTEQTLQETLARCVADLGHLPQVAEFDHWRQRELDLARASGDDALHLPSATPYRKRWETWAGALSHFGYSEAAIEGRLERQ